MSKAEWYGNFDCVARKDNYEEMIIKKEALQKKFIEMCSKKEKSTINKKEESNKKVFRKSSKNNLSNREKDLMNEIKKMKKEIQSLKKSNDKLKKEKFLNSENIKSKTAEFNQYKKSINKTLKEVEILKKENYKLKEKLDSIQNNDLNKELASIKSENFKLKQSNSSLNGKLKIAIKQIQNYQQIRNGVVESNIIKKYQHNIKEKENELENIKAKYISATATINILNNKMLSRKKNNIKEKADKYKVKTVQEIADVNIEENIIFGFLSLNKDLELIFIDLNNKRYSVINKISNEDKNKYIGMPTRVIELGEKTVKLDYVYYNLVTGSKVKAINKDKPFKVRAKNNKEKEVHVLKDEFKNKKILIVGSKNKDKYVSAFKSSGADILWYDSFSDNESRLEDMSLASDIVLVCTSHVSHSTMYKLYSLDEFKDNVKYQLIEKDNTNNLISRVRYAFENMDKKVVEI